MILSDLSRGELAARLRAGELAFRCGPFVVRIASPVERVETALRLLYADYELSDGFADFRLEVAPPGLLRRWLRPQVVFTSDGDQPFAPFPLDQSYPLLEWGLNWCISSVVQRYIIVHAGVVERDGRVLIMPGRPGTGKSTLTAALVHRGWRLFSDELALIDIEDRSFVPLPRPISLKNQSIDAIRAFAPDAVFGPPTHNTPKGTINHVKVPTGHIRRAQETARAGWVIFPTYAEGAAPSLSPHSPADAVLEIAGNSFNFRIHGRTGFDVVCDAVAASACFDFEYGALEDAVAAFDRLLSPVPA